MSITDQLQLMYDTLNDWAGEGNAQNYAVQIVPDLAHMWYALLNTSQSSQILIMYNGEQIRGEFGIAAQLARVDRRFVVVVSRGQSLTFPLSQQYLKPTQNAVPLYNDVETIRDIVRGLQFDPVTTERPVDYMGIVPFATDGSGKVMDAMQIELSVGVQLELIESTPDVLAQTA